MRPPPPGAPLCSTPSACWPSGTRPGHHPSRPQARERDDRAAGAAPSFAAHHSKLAGPVDLPESSAVDVKLGKRYDSERGILGGPGAVDLISERASRQDDFAAQSTHRILRRSRGTSELPERDRHQYRVLATFPPGKRRIPAGIIASTWSLRQSLGGPDLPERDRYKYRVLATIPPGKRSFPTGIATSTGYLRQLLGDSELPQSICRKDAVLATRASVRLGCAPAVVARTPYWRPSLA
jgi:hypothetical protein